MNSHLGERLAASAIQAMVGTVMGCAGGQSPADTPTVVEVTAVPVAAPPTGAVDQQTAEVATPEAPPKDTTRSRPDWDGRKQGNCCKGLNECKGKGNCKTDDNDCAGKNECKGKGGCKGADCNDFE